MTKPARSPALVLVLVALLVALFAGGAQARHDNGEEHDDGGRKLQMAGGGEVAGLYRTLKGDPRKLQGGGGGGGGAGGYPGGAGQPGQPGGTTAGGSGGAGGGPYGGAGGVGGGQPYPYPPATPGVTTTPEPTPAPPTPAPPTPAPQKPSPRGQGGGYDYYVCQNCEGKYYASQRDL